MDIQSLVCVNCGHEHSPDNIQYRCRDCDSSLSATYDYKKLKDRVSWETFQSRPFDHSRYRELLPVVEEAHRITLDEGGTPLMEERRLGLDMELFFKVESHNPTGSFKDRGTSMELGRALQHDVNKIVMASTGNMGSSISAYTARAGVHAKIFVPEDVVTGPKFKHMKSHGAEIVYVDGGYQQAAENAWAEWEQGNRYLMGDYPYRAEGEKTLGFELAEQIDADFIVMPIGNGTMIHAVWKAFKELKLLGLIDQTPKIVGVQSEGCNTVVRAFQNDEREVESIAKAHTIAGAIACENPLDGEPALEALYESNGFGIVVAEEEIEHAKKLLATKEGLYTEEAGATAMAGILKNMEYFEQSTVVCGITGHGLKT